MEKPFQPLMGLNFAGLVAEAKATTKTGEQILARYNQYFLEHAASCSVVNRFMTETANHLYDGGIAWIVEQVSEVMRANQVSWALASVCESIEADQSPFNFIKRNAAKQVGELLEQKEEDVIKWIKGGALKNVMHVVEFRNIVNSVYQNNRVSVNEEFTAIKPISFTEVKEGSTFFEVLGRIFQINENGISESDASAVSNDFLIISRLLESQIAKYENDALTISTSKANYVISSITEGENTKVVCKRVAGDKETTFESVDALREHNRLVVGTYTYNQQANMESLLESVAKCFEHFDDIVVADNCQIISTPRDKFIVIENGIQMYAQCLASNHTALWTVNKGIVEALDFIKSKTNVDINEQYKSNIEEALGQKKTEEEQQIRENLEKAAMDARKQKIEQLVEQYKDDPAMLKVLASVSEELATL